MSVVESNSIQKSDKHYTRIVLLQYSVALLQQAIDLLNETIVKDEDLSKQSTVTPGSTIGKHLRHIYDHFRLLFEPKESKEVCYETRRRNVPMETSHLAAQECFQTLKDELEKYSNGQDIDKFPAQKTVRIVLGDDELLTNTSFDREIWYVCMHTIHHFATIRTIVVGEFKYSLPEDFGYAPSTLAAQAEAAANSSRL